MAIDTAVRVRFWLRDDSSFGSIVINQQGMSIKDKSGQKVFSNELDIVYEMREQIIPRLDGKQDKIVLESPVRVVLKPLVQKSRMYNPSGEQFIEDIFPPSSYGFYGRMKNGDSEFLYIVQEVIDDSRYWLTIANPNNSHIHEAHFINQFEAEALSLIDSQEFRNIWYASIWSKIPTSERSEILDILDEPSVSWKELAKLLRDISIPNLKIGKTMRETLSQLVPQTFPIDVQEQLMLFLSIVLKKGLPKTDPINYLYKYWSFPIVGALLEGHLICLVEGVEWPSYLKILTLAGRKHLTDPVRAIDSNVSESPWLMFWEKVSEQFPDWFDIAANMVRELNIRGEIISKFPITAADAKTSIDSWKKRLSTLIYELRLIGRLDPQSLGLVELVYLGAAYRWPHKHMKYITKLGSKVENQPYLQVMVMPPSAALKVKRILPSIMNVIWTCRTYNIDLFNVKNKSWEVPINRIMSSVEDVSSFRRIAKRTGIWTNINNYRLTQEEAKAIDLASEGIRLAGLERKEYLEPWGFDSKRIQYLLSDLSKRGIIHCSYEATNDKLISLSTIIHGPPEKVTSVCDAFLECTPTSLVKLGEKYQQAVILSRLPETLAYNLVSHLPKMGMEQDLIIRCLRPTTFQSYTHNLLQRLLKNNGTWDDDVSGFLSQARSRKKELSESNA